MKEAGIMMKNTMPTMEMVDADAPRQMEEVRELVAEYFTWGNSLSVSRHGFNFDISRMLVDFLDDRRNYTPPHGMLYLLRVGQKAVGLGGFKRIDRVACELKRMYVKEAFQKNGYGAKLLRQLIADAKKCGYSEMRLESARFMENAFNLYKKFGFEEIPLYSGIETPPEYQSISYCMRLTL